MSEIEVHTLHWTEYHTHITTSQCN